MGLWTSYQTNIIWFNSDLTQKVGDLSEAKETFILSLATTQRTWFTFTWWAQTI